MVTATVTPAGGGDATPVEADALAELAAAAGASVESIETTEAAYAAFEARYKDDDAFGEAEHAELTPSALGEAWDSVLAEVRKPHSVPLILVHLITKGTCVFQVGLPDGRTLAITATPGTAVILQPNVRHTFDPTPEGYDDDKLGADDDAAADKFVGICMIGANTHKGDGEPPAPTNFDSLFE